MAVSNKRCRPWQNISWRIRLLASIWLNGYAIKVLGKYTDDAWLGRQGIRQGTDHGEWPVAYHGTLEMNATGIVKEGFSLDKGRRFLFGKGIYATPNPQAALDYSAVYNFKSPPNTFAKFMVPFFLVFITIGLCFVGSSSGLRCHYEESIHGVGGMINGIKAKGADTCPGSSLLARCTHVECSVGRVWKRRQSGSGMGETRGLLTIKGWLDFPKLTMTMKKCLSANTPPVQEQFCALLLQQCEQDIARELEQKMGIFSGVAKARLDRCELCAEDIATTGDQQANWINVFNAIFAYKICSF